MKTLVNKILVITLLATSLSCIHNNFDDPKINSITIGEVLTLEQLFEKYIDSIPYKFKTDISVYANVNMDDKLGNIYKSAYIQDATRGINLRLLSSGGLYQGDSIRLNLNGTTLNKYRQMLQIDSVHVDNNIQKIATKRDIKPEIVSIEDITDAYIGRLIKMEDVEFAELEVGKIFSAAETSENRMLENCNGESIIVRTSGYASFASETVPVGRGSIIAVVGRYDNELQLFIRSMKELNFTLRRCGEAYFYEDFSSVANGETINLPDWKNISQVGSLKWKGFSQNNTDKMASIINDGNENTTWLITPKQNIKNPTLKFQSRTLNLNTSRLAIMISTNYDGSNNPENFTWTEIPASISNNGTFVDSGNIDLSSYSNINFYIAFKFTGVSGNKGTVHLKNIAILEED